MPYHVDRSKIFAIEPLGNSPVIDASRVVEAIELTRFPSEKTAQTDIVPRLVQAADLIGQLGDPMYPRKVNALFYEFEETGRNPRSAVHPLLILVDKYPEFFWNTGLMHLDEAIKYLNLTVSGRQWIANLHGRRLMRGKCPTPDGSAALTSAAAALVPALGACQRHAQYR